MRILARGVGMALLVAAHAAAQELPKGRVIPHVACADAPEQSYALYLPSQYTPQRAWPILYVFDPAARGERAVEAFRAAAEARGYIVVASNNSRNGESSQQQVAANAVWLDTQKRFALDRARLYAAGFSGGARLAISIALGCNGCMAGVIAEGAGYPANREPRNGDAIALFAVAGDEDFNHRELVGLREKLEAAGVAHRIRYFEGRHDWAPVEVNQEALEWLDLKAMQAGTLAKDEGFIARHLAARRAQAEESGRAGQIAEAVYEYRALASELRGLAAVDDLAAKAARLAASKEFREQKKDEARIIEREQRLVTGAWSAMAALPEPDLAARAAYQAAAIQSGRLLVRGLEKAKTADERKLYRRVFAGTMARAFEMGQERMERGEFDLARAYFEIAAEIDEKNPRVPLNIARARVRSGNRKAALDAIEQAVKRGLKDAALLERIEDFAALRDEPRYKAALEQMRAEPAK